MEAQNVPERSILAAVRAIPPGFVRTYGDIWPPAPRLAGHVLAHANVAGLPWWRVVRADGSLAVGEDQRRRLDAEGIPFRGGGSRRVDLRVARLPPGLERVVPRRALRRRRSAS